MLAAARQIGDPADLAGGRGALIVRRCQLRLARPCNARL
jgi:hypothetical protein